MTQAFFSSMHHVNVSQDSPCFQGTCGDIGDTCTPKVVWRRQRCEVSIKPMIPAQQQPTTHLLSFSCRAVLLSKRWFHMSEPVPQLYRISQRTIRMQNFCSWVSRVVNFTVNDRQIDNIRMCYNKQTERSMWSVGTQNLPRYDNNKERFSHSSIALQKKRRAKGGNERRQTKAARAVQMGNAQKKTTLKGEWCERDLL